MQVVLSRCQASRKEVEAKATNIIMQLLASLEVKHNGLHQLGSKCEIVRLEKTRSVKQ